MNSSAPEEISSTVALSLAEMNVDNLSMITPSKKALFLSTYNRRQNFTLPDSFLLYITKNPKNAYFYQKIVRCCKYFFIQNPILVFPNFGWIIDGWKFYIDRKGNTNFNMKNCSSKLWLTYNFDVDYVNGWNKNVVSLIIPKIYRCDLTRLYLVNQIVSYNQFMILCSSVQYLTLKHVTLKYDDGTEVAFEKLIEQLPQLKRIYYTFTIPSNNISKATFKELWKIPHLSNYDRFTLYNIPENFDIDSFYNYMKKNRKTRIVLFFSNTISEEYKTRLEAIIDEIIETNNHEYKPPFITCPQ